MALYVVMGSVFGGLLVGLGVMTGFWFISRQGFMFFGPATVAGFVVALGILAARGIRMTGPAALPSRESGTKNR